MLVRNLSTAFLTSGMTMQALISACEKGGRLDQALKAYADMLEAGMQPDMITYSNLLTGVSSTSAGRVLGDNEQSVQPVLLQQLQPLLQESNPTDGVLALDAAACEKHNELGKALDLLEKMHLAGFAGSPPNYASIITQVRPSSFTSAFLSERACGLAVP